MTSSVWAALLVATLVAVSSQLGLIVVTQSLTSADILHGKGYASTYRFDQPIFRWRIFTFLADDRQASIQSDIVLEEDGRPLGPAHSEQSQVETAGHGAHCVGTDNSTRVLIFSSSDNIQARERRYDVRLHLRAEPRVFRYLLVALIFMSILTIFFSNGVFRDGGPKAHIPPKEVSLSPTSAALARANVLASASIYALALLLILALINGAELFKDRTNFRLQEEGRVPTVSESVIYWKVRSLLDGSVPDKDVVFVGDSSALMSIMPKEFTRLTNLSSISLSFDGSYTLEFQNRILELYLKTHRSPQTIVTHFSYIILGSGSAPQGIEMFLAQRDRGLNWLENFEHNTRRPKFNLEGVSFYYSSKFLIRKLGETVGFHFRDEALDRPRGVFGSDTEVARFIKASDGFLPNPNAAPEGGPPHIDGFFEFPEYMASMLRGLFTIARDHGSTLIYIMNPLSEKYATPGNLAQLRRVETRLREVARGYENVCIAEPSIRFYPDSEAWDNAHLVEGGLTKETQFVADAVATECGRARRNP